MPCTKSSIVVCELYSKYTMLLDMLHRPEC